MIISNVFPASQKTRQRGFLLNPHRFGAAAPPAFTDPLTISGCKLWLDADDASTITSSGGQASDWTDKTGAVRGAANYVFSQATSGLQPLVNNTYFSKNCLDFDRGATGWLKSSTDIPAPVDNTMFIVCYWGNKSNTYLSLNIQKGTPSDAIQYGTCYPVWNHYSPSNAAAAFQVEYTGSVYAYTTGAGYQTKGTRGLTTCKSPAVQSGSVINSNGIAKAISYTGTNPGSLVFNTIGNSDTLYVCNGAFAEIILYDTILSAGDTSDVEGYLKTKWGTP